LLNIAYVASLRTEENRFVRGSLTFSNPSVPDIDPPLRHRADYPRFTAFGHPVPLSVETVVKLSRAIDKWSGSIAVYGTKATDMIAWGVVDQIVHQNVRLNRESEGGAANPGQLTIAMDSVGEISVYHRDLWGCPESCRN
jgi:hypothetical protein